MSHYPDDQPQTFWQRLVALWRWLVSRFTWRDDAISNTEANTIAIRAGQVDIYHLIKKGFQDMAEREDAAWARNAELVQSVKDGFASLITERDQYKAALEAADADKAAAVQAALDADSDVDAAKVEAANAALDELVNPAPPADNGGGEVVDDGSGDDVPVDENTGNE